VSTFTVNVALTLPTPLVASKVYSVVVAGWTLWLPFGRVTAAPFRVRLSAPEVVHETVDAIPGRTR
jgi:hypothetical protein